VGGSAIEHRCLRCGAVVGDPEPAASSEHGPSAPVDEGPALAGLPPTIADADGDGDEEGMTALHALKELGELHAAGVVTDAEFAVKKAELLRRV
jgi:Short C-terminal domain